MRKPTSSFHSEIKSYTIFAIITNDDGENLAYIGKTVVKDLNAVLRRHLRGEVSLTKSVFSIDTASNTPVIIPLERISCSGSEAYRHTLCWNRILDDHGYITISYEGTDYQSYNMDEKTKAIYDCILSSVSVDNILSKTQCPAFSATEEDACKPAKENEPCIQLNIRVNSDDKDLFCRLCRENGITQQEGFARMLLSSSMLNEQEKSLIASRISNELKQHLYEKDDKIRELKKRLSGLSRGQAADLKLKAALKNANHLIREYVYLNFVPPAESPLKCHSWNAHKRLQNPDLQYSYPPEAGCSIVFLESLCYSKGTVPAIFLHTREVSTNALFKLRYYPSAYFVGLSPKSTYAQSGSVWLVSYAPAPDGAMALNFALPLFSESYIELRKDSSKPPSLDEIINKINQHNS